MFGENIVQIVLSSNIELGLHSNAELSCGP